jgi:polyisoprenoid-binding protein YceI
MIKKWMCAALLALPAAAAAAGVTFPDGKACAAWKTKKTMFLFKKLEPVGMNCAVTAKVTTDGAGKRVIVEIPIASFDSGEPARDKQVRVILKADVAPSMVFTSRVYAPAEWESVSAGKAATIEGTLAIGGESFAISAPISLSAGPAPVASGEFKTTFAYFKIAPPKVAGGLIASVQDYLELHYSIPLAAVVQ